MKITPVDIEQQQFRVRLRGFDIAEVDAFLDLVAEEMESLIRENMGLKDQIKHLRDELEACRSKEKMINETIINCQKIVADLKANAEKEAELIISKANVDADRMIAEAHQRLARVNEEILDAKKRRIQFETALKSLLESHLKILEMEIQEEDEQ